jgi:hypothetical protein
MRAFALCELDGSCRIRLRNTRSLHRLSAPLVLLSLAAAALMVALAATFAVRLLRRRTRIGGEDLGSVSAHWLSTVHRDTNP